MATFELWKTTTADFRAYVEADSAAAALESARSVEPDWDFVEQDDVVFVSAKDGQPIPRPAGTPGPQRCGHEQKAGAHGYPQ